MGDPFVICGTGHRPPKLGGYGDKARADLIDFARRTLMVTLEDHPHRDLKVISGMALGWDIALAQASVILGIPFIAAIPFVGQEKAWPQESQDFYNSVLALAEKKEIVCSGGYAPEKMLERNRWMVDNSSLVLALWDGSHGGTGHCVNYAKQQGKQIRQLWQFWREEH